LSYARKTWSPKPPTQTTGPNPKSLNRFPSPVQDHHNPVFPVYVCPPYVHETDAYDSTELS
jgi:hypothetical protein